MQNQKTVSDTIAVQITKHAAEKIISSGGNAHFIDSIARNLESGCLFVK